LSSNPTTDPFVGKTVASRAAKPARRDTDAYAAEKEGSKKMGAKKRGPVKAF